MVSQDCFDEFATHQNSLKISLVDLKYPSNQFRWTTNNRKVKPDNARQVLEAGANAIVAGSAIFGVKDYATAIAGLRYSQRPELIVAEV